MQQLVMHTAVSGQALKMAIPAGFRTCDHRLRKPVL